MANTVARKYILIPNYAPLYAMQKCYGPTQAPLTKPTLTPVDIIGQLMNQTGRERVTIYEVVKTPTGFSTPVQLTKTNYRLPYEQIAGIKLEYLEAHSLVKHPGGGILLVYVYELHAQFVKRPLYEFFAQSLAEIVGMEKEHLYLPLLHAHEPDGA